MFVSYRSHKSERVLSPPSMSGLRIVRVSMNRRSGLFLSNPSSAKVSNQQKVDVNYRRGTTAIYLAILKAFVR